MLSIMKKYIYIVGLLLLIPFVAIAQQELDDYLVIAAKNIQAFRLNLKNTWLL